MVLFSHICRRDDQPDNDCATTKPTLTRTESLAVSHQTITQRFGSKALFVCLFGTSHQNLSLWGQASPPAPQTWTALQFRLQSAKRDGPRIVGFKKGWKNLLRVIQFSAEAKTIDFFFVRWYQFVVGHRVKWYQFDIGRCVGRIIILF